MKYFLLAVLYLCLIPVYFMLRNETKPKKNIILGVTLPYEARQDAAVQAICDQFLRQLNLVVLILALLPVALLPIKRTFVFLTVCLVWIIAAVIAPYIPYVQCHKRLRAYKQQACAPAERKGETLVDLRLAALPKKMVSPLWFLPPLVMALVPILHTLATAPRDASFPWMLFGYGINFLMVLLFTGLYRLINRQRAEVVDENTALTAALTRVRRYQWGRAWLAFTWLTGLFSLGFWLLLDSSIGILLLSLGYVGILVTVCIRTEFAARRAQESLTAESGQGFFADDDCYWIYGLIYYNPNDKHLSINNRVGMGMTFNFAHWAGKLILGISVLLLLAMPFIGVWMIHLETTPITLTLNENELVATHTKELCRLERAEIRSAALLEELPDVVKLSGTGIDTFLQGKFRLEGYGVCELCLNPEAPPFLLLETAEGTWLLGAESEAEARALYAELTGN